jgi:hypothetical protein
VQAQDENAALAQAMDQTEVEAVQIGTHDGALPETGLGDGEQLGDIGTTAGDPEIGSRLEGRGDN